MTTTTDPKTYARALLNRNGSRRDMAPAAVQAAIKGWNPDESMKTTRPKARKRTPKTDTRSDARKHVNEVSAARKKAIADTVKGVTARRRKRELNKASSLEFRSTLSQAGRAQSANDAAADAEADAAEAKAMGKAPTVKGKTSPKKGAKLLAQYESMAQGPERLAFWNSNKSAILRALDNR
jgi:hypothetical protein